MFELMEMFQLIPDWVREFIAAIIIILALAQCYFGLKIFRFQVAVVTFFVGFILGTIGIAVAIDEVTIGVAMLLGAFIGCVLAFVSWNIFRLFVFLGVFGITFLLMFLSLVFPQDVQTALTAGLIFGLIMGIAAVFLAKPVIIFATAIPAGIAISNNLPTIIGDGNASIAVIIGVICAVTGIIYQFKSNRNMNTDGSRKHPSEIQPPLSFSERLEQIVYYVKYEWATNQRNFILKSAALCVTVIVIMAIFIPQIGAGSLEGEWFAFAENLTFSNGQFEHSFQVTYQEQIVANMTQSEILWYTNMHWRDPVDGWFFWSSTNGIGVDAYLYPRTALGSDLFTSSFLRESTAGDRANSRRRTYVHTLSGQYFLRDGGRIELVFNCGHSEVFELTQRRNRLELRAGWNTFAFERV